MLTLDSLIRKGYLHDHVVPALNTSSLADCLPHLPVTHFDPSHEIWKLPAYSRCVRHSVPKRRHSRRFLAIPNPQHQIPLCLTLADRLYEIERHCLHSSLSLSTPAVRNPSDRAVAPSSYLRDLSSERVIRSAGCRFHLYADFARHYGSIYTHTIGWRCMARTPREQTNARAS